MQDLRLAYLGPTAPLDGANVAQVFSTLETLMQSGGRLCGWRRSSDLVCIENDSSCQGCPVLRELIEALQALERRFDARLGAIRDPVSGVDTFAGKGNVRVRRLCPGHAGAPRQARGFVRIRFTFAFGLGFNPVLWGEFRGCQLELFDLQVTLDGSYRFVLGDAPFALADIPLIPSIFAFSGQVRAQGLRDNIAIDFGAGVGLGAELRIRIPLADGTHLFVTQQSGMVGVEARNGTWRCDLLTQRCTALADTGLGAGAELQW
ncbi:MAG: hypothetical protein ACPGUV_00810 [Polyangiales bacterium]